MYYRREIAHERNGASHGVRGFVSCYFGAVYGVKSKKFLKPAIGPGGYLRVKLYRDARGKSIPIHRIVATSFISNTSNKSQVNHKDGNKRNNRVSNLEWVTQSENQIHAYKNGLNTTAYAVEATKKRVVQKTIDGKVVKIWNSLSDAGRATGVAVPNITHCCKGRINHAGGYKWDYLDC